MIRKKPVSPDVQLFDLYKAGDILHENGQIFDSMTKQCSKKFEIELSGLVQGSISVEGGSEVEKKHIDARNCDRFIKEWVVVNDKRHAFAVVSLEKKLLFTLMELMCGGGQEFAIEPEVKDSLTAAEQQFFEKVINILFQKMEEVIAPITRFSMKLVDSYVDKSDAEQINYTQEEFITTDLFYVRACEISGVIKIEYPKSLIKETLSLSREHIEPEELLRQLKESLEEVPLPVAGVIPLDSLSLSSTLRIKEGDILPLPNMPVTDVYVGGRFFTKAELVARSDRLCLELKD